MKYTYASEKFATARRSLMLPHPDGDTKSIADAFAECSHGLHNINRDDFDDATRESVRKLEELMGTTGLDDPLHRGLYTIKAERLSLDQKTELSKEVDYLATWFDAQSRE
ncbi:MAG: hypothetical protein V3R78_02435 [Thermodesulfobacteriota bacterium]